MEVVFANACLDEEHQIYLDDFVALVAVVPLLRLLFLQSSESCPFIAATTRLRKANATSTQPQPKPHTASRRWLASSSSVPPKHDVCPIRSRSSPFENQVLQVGLATVLSHLAEIPRSTLKTLTSDNSEMGKPRQHVAFGQERSSTTEGVPQGCLWRT